MIVKSKIPLKQRYYAFFKAHKMVFKIPDFRIICFSKDQNTINKRFLKHKCIKLNYIRSLIFVITGI